MKTKDEILRKYINTKHIQSKSIDLIHKAMFEYANQYIIPLSEANKLTLHHISESVKKDIEISKLMMELAKLNRFMSTKKLNK